MGKATDFKFGEYIFRADQNWANFGVFGGLGVTCYKKLRFLLQKHMCLWIHVVWAILRQNRLRGVTSRSVRGKKNPESHRASHRKDMSPLTQGLNYRSACDRTTGISNRCFLMIDCMTDSSFFAVLPVYWVLMSAGPDLNPIRPCSVKCGALT